MPVSDPPHDADTGEPLAGPAFDALAVRAQPTTDPSGMVLLGHWDPERDVVYGIHEDLSDAARAGLVPVYRPSGSAPLDIVLWEGETVAIPDGSVKVSAIPGPFPHPPGTRVRVVRATDQPSEDQPPIRLDLEPETEPSSVVICQSHGQASPFYVCLREATATWRTPAGRTLSLCDEHGEYAAAEGWTADQPTEVAGDGQP